MWRKSLSGVEIVVPSKQDQLWLRRYLNGVLVGDPMPPTWTIRSYRLISDFGKQRAQVIISTDPTLTILLNAQESLVPPILDSAMIHSWAAADWVFKE